MAPRRSRRTRKLRSWLIEQVSSGKYTGLVWDDEAKTKFRIPWKHAGKQDFRKDEDAAIFKAWAEFRGKLSKGDMESPATWKTRLRCALSRSPEFQEDLERSQLDISEPYKVYRLVPYSEQGLLPSEEKKPNRKSKRRRRSAAAMKEEEEEEEEESEDDEALPNKQVKIEEVKPELQVDDYSVQTQEPALHHITTSVDTNPNTAPAHAVNEYRLDVRIEESIPEPNEGGDSLSVAVHYLGQEVLRRHIQGSDVRILYQPSSLLPPTPSAVLNGRFPRIPLPEPPSSVPAGEELRALRSLLPFMERGVVLTCMQQGVYGKRYCRGRVFWVGPHTTAPGLHKMERESGPSLLFSRDTFKQQLDHFCSHGGDAPKSSFTLCFGEELNDCEDLSKKLIIAEVTLPWAEQQVQDARSVRDSITFIQSLAAQSPLGEITLDLVAVPTPEACVP